MSHLPELACAFLLTLGAVPLLARRAAAWGLLDVPGARSVHATPVARVGGLGLGVGIAGGIALLSLRTGPVLDDWLPYLLPALLYLAIGLVDDVRSIRARWKFAAQCGAAALAVALGLRWEGTGLGPFGDLGFGAATPLLSWLWLVAVVMLVNFVDGIDLITCVGAGVLLAAGAGGEAGPGDGSLYALAGAAVLGLVFWNATPARAFPGDAATHLLGFLVGTLALHVPAHASSGAAATRALPWVAASAPLLPGVLDVALGLLAKARRGVPLARAHNQHLYQRLTRRGRPHAAVAVRYGALALAALFLVTRVAPGLGLGWCVGLSVAVLLWHLGGGLRETARLPWRFADAEP